MRSARACSVLLGSPAPAVRSFEGLAVHVVIMGCGRVGSTLAKTLEGLGHSVSVLADGE